MGEGNTVGCTHTNSVDADYEMQRRQHNLKFLR